MATLTFLMREVRRDCWFGRYTYEDCMKFKVGRCSEHIASHYKFNQEEFIKHVRRNSLVTLFHRYKRAFRNLLCNIYILLTLTKFLLITIVKFN